MHRAIEAHLGTRQVSRVIYGAIIGLALVVALEEHPPRSGMVLASLVATALAVALAELYSEIVGAETHTRRHVGRERLGPMLDDAAAVAFGIAFPGVFFLLAAVGAMSSDSAFTIAKWSGLGLIAFYGFCAGRLAGDGLGAALLQSVAVGLIGGALIALKALIH